MREECDERWKHLPSWWISQDLLGSPPPNQTVCSFGSLELETPWVDAFSSFFFRDLGAGLVLIWIALASDTEEGIKSQFKLKDGV